MNTNKKRFGDLLSLIIFGLLLLGGCRTTSVNHPHLCGGMGEFELQDKALRKEWYRMSGEENDSSDLEQSDRKPYLTEKEQPQNFSPSKKSENVVLQLELPPLPFDLSESQTIVQSFIPEVMAPYVPVDQMFQAAHALSPIRQVQFIDAVKREDKAEGEEAPENLAVPRMLSTSGETPLQPAKILPGTPTGSIIAPPLSWKDQTQQAIVALRKELEEKKSQKTITPEEEMRLHLLEVSIGTEVSVQGLSNTTLPLEQFWQEQCQGLSTLLEGNLLNNGNNALVLNTAADHFQKGLDSLVLECPLAIKKAIFVQSAAPFGLYQVFEGKYYPGETLHLYAELDHVISRHTSKGEEISIRCGWELFDTKGKPVSAHQEEDCQSLSETRLRDIVLNIAILIPPELPRGNYLLELSVRDLNDTTRKETVQRLPLTVH